MSAVRIAGQKQRCGLPAPFTGTRRKQTGISMSVTGIQNVTLMIAAHRKSKLPMGTLANGDLRNKRIQAHKAFDWLWKSGLMTKRQAYKWMQAKLALSEDQAHIAKYSEYMCDVLIALCEQTYTNIKMTA